MGIIPLLFYGCSSLFLSSTIPEESSLEEIRSPNVLADLFEIYAWRQYQQGEYLKAVRYHISAAAVSANILTEDRDILYGRNMEEASRKLSEVTLQLLTAPDKGMVSQGFDERLTIGVTANGTPLLEVPVEIAERVVQVDQSYVDKKNIVPSDEEGKISVELSAPRTVGVHRVRVRSITGVCIKRH